MSKEEIRRSDLQLEELITLAILHFDLGVYGTWSLGG